MIRTTQRPVQPAALQSLEFTVAECAQWAYKGSSGWKSDLGCVLSVCFLRLVFFDLFCLLMVFSSGFVGVFFVMSCCVGVFLELLELSILICFIPQVVVHWVLCFRVFCGLVGIWLPFCFVRGFVVYWLFLFCFDDFLFWVFVCKFGFRRSFSFGCLGLDVS